MKPEEGEEEVVETSDENRDLGNVTSEGYAGEDVGCRLASPSRIGSSPV